jgi:DNA invertase Pin-like site-specific DNA recombinase
MENTKISTIRCAIYNRSAVEVALNDAERIQRLHECEKYIELHDNWALTKVYEDNGASGNTLDRPGLQELLSDVRADKIDCVVIYDMPNLTRSPQDWNTINETFKEHGVCWECVARSMGNSENLLKRQIIFESYKRRIFEIKQRLNKVEAI